MSEISVLLERGWITKYDPEFYEIKSYVRKNREEIAGLLSRFGWRIVTEPNCIAVRKYKSIQEEINHQGVPNFKSKQDYLNLIIFLMFLSQASHQTVFTLEEAMDYLKTIINEEKIETDVTSKYFSYSVYRTLLYMEKVHLLERLDGKLDELINKNIRIPGILYKNTGMYQYFQEKQKYREKAGTEQSVYQKLYGQTVAVISKKEYGYLQKNAEKIENDFRTICDENVELVYGQNYAYINHMEGFHFPNENNRKDWMLLRVCRQLQQAKKEVISREHFIKVLEKVRMEDSLYWTQEMAKWGKQSYESFVIKELEKKNLIKKNGNNVNVNPLLKDMKL